MSKKEQHIQYLSSHIDEFVVDGNTEKLIGYMLSNSNLPGQRANLELAEAFGDVIEKYLNGEHEKLWGFCTSLAKISVDEAPTNTSKEFLPFCGAIGIGAIGSTIPKFYNEAAIALKTLANDPRWRMREAVCFGLQRLLKNRSKDTLKKLEEWVNGGSLLEMRAAAAGVAEPTILGNKEVAAHSLQIHKLIFNQILELVDRKTEKFKVLRKGLGYTLSVVVSAIPKEGFKLMKQLIASQNKDLLWIVKQNITKKRLIENYPQEVEAIQHLLN